MSINSISIYKLRFINFLYQSNSIYKIQFYTKSPYYKLNTYNSFIYKIVLFKTSITYKIHLYFITTSTYKISFINNFY